MIGGPEELGELCRRIENPNLPVEHREVMNALREAEVPENLTVLEEEYRNDGFWCSVSGLLGVLELCKHNLQAELDCAKSQLVWGKPQYRKTLVRIPEPLLKVIAAFLIRRKKSGLG